MRDVILCHLDETSLSSFSAVCRTWYEAVSDYARVVCRRDGFLAGPAVTEGRVPYRVFYHHLRRRQALEKQLVAQDLRSCRPLTGQSYRPNMWSYSESDKLLAGGETSMFLSY